jgi:hypothetical protein
MPDLERGTLRGPPLSLVSTTDSRWRRSGHQLWDGPPMSPPEVHNYWPTIGQAMTCSHRWGSSSNGLPLRSRAQDPGQARGRHDEGEASGFPHEAHHGRTTDEPLAPADKTPAQRVHDEVGKVHDVGTGLPALAHTGAWVGARRAAKHQPRGFMVEPTGVRDDRKAWAIAWLRPMNRYAAIPSDRSPSPSVRRASAEPTAAERRPECPAVPCLDTHPHPPGGEGIWPAHSAREPMASPAPVPPVYATDVSSQRRPQGRKERHCSEPIGLTIQLPFARTMNLS